MNNWEQIGGEAKYFIEEEAIVGEAVLNTPNSFLTTKETYGDFILELEIFVSSYMNSGVQIRSNTNSEYRDGVFHGYQGGCCITYYCHMMGMAFRVVIRYEHSKQS